MIQYIQYTIQEINRKPSITTNQNPQNKSLPCLLLTFDIFLKHFLFVKVLPFFSHAIGTPSSSESVRRLADLRYKDHRLQALQPLQTSTSYTCHTCHTSWFWVEHGWAAPTKRWPGLYHRCLTGWRMWPVDFLRHKEQHCRGSALNAKALEIGGFCDVQCQFSWGCGLLEWQA